MELKNLSYEELKSLQQKVQLEMGRRNAFKKSDTNVYARIYSAIEDSVTQKGTINIYAPYKYSSDIESAIFKLCDIALKNYKIKEHARDGKKYIQVNGSTILSEKKDYQSMCDELVEVFLKYLNVTQSKKEKEG